MVDRSWFEARPGAEGIGAVMGPGFEAVWRTEFGGPGFWVLDLGAGVHSTGLRRAMLGVRDGLNAEAGRRGLEGFVVRSLGRFDQQVTTRFHLDGAPERSLLVLGYEPSTVVSRLAMADYTRCAHDLGLEPRRFLDEFNPMFRAGEERLAPYVTEVPPAPPGHSRIVLINNSCLPHDPVLKNPLGVLHKAEIPEPDPSKSRVINSMMLAVGVPEEVTRAQEEAFVMSEEVRRGY